MSEETYDGYRINVATCKECGIIEYNAYQGELLTGIKIGDVIYRADEICGPCLADAMSAESERRSRA